MQRRLKYLSKKSNQQWTQQYPWSYKLSPNLAEKSFKKPFRDGDVPETWDKHKYHYYDIWTEGKLLGPFTAQQHSTWYAILLQIKPMTFNPLMGCGHFIHWQGQETSKISNRAGKAAKNKQLPSLYYVSKDEYDTMNWEQSPTNTWNPLWRCTNDK